MEKIISILNHPSIIILTLLMDAISIVLSFSEGSIYRIICIIIIGIAVLIQSIFFIKFHCNLKKAKQKIKDDIKKEVNENIENTLNEIAEYVKSTVENSLDCKNKLSTEDHFEALCKTNCKAINKILLDICNIDFSVCLKRICVNKVIDFNYTDASTKTIARSGYKSAEREKNDLNSQKIAENTSFLNVLKGNIRCWASPNLEETENNMKKVGEEYKNPDTEYKNYYNSTIVAPIRISAKKISPKILEFSEKSNPEGYHYLAFLCVDSPKKFDINDSNFKFAMAILPTIGDALYPLFENKLIKTIGGAES